MNLATYSFSLDVHKRGSQLMLEAKKNDTGRKLLVTLMENGKPYNITSDCYAVFRARKTDGTVLYNDCSIEDNEISYTITQQTLAVPGILDCEITLYGSDGKQVTSPNFSIIVDDTVQSDDEVESTNEYTALTKAMSDYADAKENLGSITGGGTARIADVELLASKWQGSTYPYSQVVSIPGVTEFSQVDLTPSVEQLAIFYNKDLAFVTENEDGVVTVYAIGQKPAKDYTIQCTITEVII